jgi:hypothetical protein
MCAANAAHVITNRPDDERDMVNRLRAEIGLGSLCDNLAFHNRHRLGYECAIFADPDQALRVPVSRHHV